MSLADDMNTALGARQMIDQLRRIIAAHDNGFLRVNSKSVAIEAGGARVSTYEMDTAEGGESIRATLKITEFQPRLVDPQRKQL